MNVLEPVETDPGSDPASSATGDPEPSGTGGRSSHTPGGDDLQALLEAGIRAALDSSSVAEGEISLTLVDDARIRELNRRYLDRDRPTDVISFPLYEEGEPVVGDIYVGVDQARRQAVDHGVPLEEELLRLAVHGTLHALGHDHPEGDEESEMFRLQEELVDAVLADSGASAEAGS